MDNDEELDIDSLFDDGEEGQEVQNEPEQPEEPEQEQGASEPEGEAQEAEPKDNEALEGETPETEEKQPVMVPIAEVHKGREKAKQYEEALVQSNAHVQQLQQSLAQYQQHFAQQQQQQNNVQPQPEQIPDPLDNPQGYADHLNSLVDQRLETVDQRHNQEMQDIVLSNSLAYAKSQYGKELAYEAMLAADQHGISRVIESSGSRDPVGDAVRWHQNQKTLQSVGGDLNSYNQQQREAIRKELMEEIEQKKADAVVDVKIPPSLSNATNAAKARNVVDADGDFTETFFE